MTNPGPDEGEVLAFVSEYIDSVPQLEALLLMWSSRPKRWLVGEMAVRLYIPEPAAHELLHDLHRKVLIAEVVGNPEEFTYSSSGNADALIAAVDELYRRQIVRVSTLIHSKPSSAVRDFARAFRFKKEKP